MKRSWRRGLLWTVVVVVLVGAGVYAFMPQPVPVDLGAVARGALSVTVDDEGRTRVKEIYVVSAPTSGRVLRIERHVGDEVVAGETVLATVEPSEPAFLDLRSRRQAESTVTAAAAAKAWADAEVARADAELDFARADQERAKTLAARDTISQRALERAELGVKTRRAALATAEAALRVKTFELETARASLINPGDLETLAAAGGCCVEVRAPVSGRVLRLLHESESVIAAGAPLLEIGDPEDLEIVIDLLSTDAVKIAVGAEVVIEDWGGGPLAGRVRRVEPYGFTKLSALGIEEQRVNVIVDLTDPPERWRALGHGYRVEARILIWHADDVLKLPVSALFREGETWAVFVLRDGRARLNPVVLGQRNSFEAEILDGLDEGARVVLHPSDRVEDGVRIVARRPG